MSFVCNYAVARFLPYPETEEFVNIGVLLHCAETDYLDFRLTNKRGRITGFFPEIHREMVQATLSAFSEELRMARGEKRSDATQLLINESLGITGRVFHEVIRPRESLVRFSSPRTAMAQNPQMKLQEIFEEQVERQFAKRREYQERLLTQRVHKVLLRAGARAFYKEEILGNAIYSARIPFVYRKQERLERGIKPLDLDKEDSTQILEHGDHWRSRMRRLQDLGCWPERFLFAVNMPDADSGPREKAAMEVREELLQQGTAVVSVSDEESVRNFAKVA